MSRTTFPRSFYYSSQRDNHTSTVYDDAQAEVVTYESNGKPYALGFRGKSQKPSFHHRFKDDEQRQWFIVVFLDNSRVILTHRKERQAARVAFRHTLKVGDVLHSSWGYEQTNCDFYEVVAVKGAVVEIREIGSSIVEGSEGYMSDRRLPIPGKHFGEVLRRRPSEGNCVRINESSNAYPWDGKECYCSWYH